MELATTVPAFGAQFNATIRRMLWTHVSGTAMSIGGVGVMDFSNAQVTTVTTANEPNNYGVALSGFHRATVCSNTITGNDTVRWGLAVARAIEFGGQVASGSTGRFCLTGRIQMSVRSRKAATTVPGSPLHMITAGLRVEVGTDADAVYTSKVVGILLETHTTSGAENQDKYVLFDGINGFGHIVTTST